MIQPTRALALVAITAALVTPLDAAAQAVIGGFNVSRGGISSVQSGSATGNFRTHVLATFPGVTFTSTQALTTFYLNTVDVLVISAVAGATTPITSLTASEQTALLHFI